MIRDDGEELATKLEPLIEGMVGVKLSKETKSHIRGALVQGIDSESVW